MNTNSKTSVIVAFVIIILASSCYSQTELEWVKQVGNEAYEHGSKIAVDNLGNVFVLCEICSDTVDMDPGQGVYNLYNSTGFLFPNVVVSKFDASGEFLWAKQFQSDTYNSAYAMTLCLDNSILIAGIFTSTTDFDPGPDTLNLYTDGKDGFICKLDSSGNFLWVKQLEGSGEISIYSIALDHSNSILLTGSLHETCDFDPGPEVYNLTSNDFSDIFLCKLNHAGNFIWAFNIGSNWHNGSSDGYAAFSDSLNNVYCSGRFCSTCDFDPGPGVFSLSGGWHGDAFLSKYDSSGNFIFAKQIGGYGKECAYDAVLCNNGTFLLAGCFSDTCDFDPGTGTYYMYSGETQPSVFICKMNYNGEFIWARKISSDDYIYGVYCNNIQTDSLSSVFVSGGFHGTADFDPGPGIFELTSHGSSDFFICKLDSLGNMVFVNQFGGSEGDEIISLYLDKYCNIYSTGYFSNTVDFDPRQSTTYNLTSYGLWDIYFQKLKQINVSVATTTQQSLIKMYPNPTENILTIELPKYLIVTNNSGNIPATTVYHQWSSATLQAIDLQGKIVLQQEVANTGTPLQVDVSRLPAGMYLLRLMYQGKQVAESKVVVK